MGLEVLQGVQGGCRGSGGLQGVQGGCRGVLGSSAPGGHGAEAISV